MADSFELKAIITAVDQMSGPLKGMSKNLKGFQKEAKSIMINAAAMGAALVTAFAVPINKAIAFESTMADVRKVVNFDTPQQFKEMSDDILTLSTQLPMAAEGIGQIVAAGGQAGIARQDLKQFASDAVKMGVAFDQTAEESGQMMATWRTAFKMSQSEVVTLADKINFLGNTGPANARKISDVVTRIGAIGKTAGLNSGQVAAMGATITGMGVESEIAATGIKNFTKTLTAGKALSKSQAGALKQLGFDGVKLSQDMQKDAAGTVLKVLETISKVDKARQSAALFTLFGSESSAAIFPMLTNLELLKTNFRRVADAQQYAGSMQKEYDSRAATTANALQLMRNQFDAASITIGEIFLPDIVKLTKKIQPMLEQFRQFVKENPELIRKTLKFGLTLVGIASSVGVATKAFKTFDSIMKMSTMGKMVSLLVIGAGLIVSNWDKVGPVVKEVWNNINDVVQLLGGWEPVLMGISTLVAGAWLTSMLKGLSGANGAAGGLAKNLRGIASMGTITVTISVLFELMKKLDSMHQEAAKNNMDIGTYMAEQVQKSESDRGYKGFIPRLKELLNVDGSQNSSVPLASPRPQQSELKVSFDNAPPGMRVTPATGAANPWNVSYDVGYSRFSGR